MRTLSLSLRALSLPLFHAIGKDDTRYEAQEGSPPQVTRSLFFKAPGHQVTFFHEKIKTTQVTGRFFKLSRSRGRPQNGPRSQVAKNPSWASDMLRKIRDNTFRRNNRPKIACRTRQRLLKTKTFRPTKINMLYCESLWLI